MGLSTQAETQALKNILIVLIVLLHPRHSLSATRSRSEGCIFTSRVNLDTDKIQVCDNEDLSESAEKYAITSIGSINECSSTYPFKESNLIGQMSRKWLPSNQGAETVLSSPAHVLGRSQDNQLICECCHMFVILWLKSTDHFSTWIKSDQFQTKLS